MIRRGRALALLGSAALHLGALAAVLSLAASLRQPEPLFVDLTGGVPAGDGREAAAAPPLGREIVVPRAREAPRARAPRASAPSLPAEPAETTSASAPSVSASREVATADQGGAPTASDMDGGGVRGVSSDAPAHAGQPSGVIGGGGSRLALAGPGTGRGEVPAEFGPYLARFRERIQELVVYPLAARRRGLAGRVEIELLLEPSGRVRDVAVVASSSHALLDEAAVEAVRSLEPQPLPEHLPHRPLRVRLPIVFELR
ncbi:MAG: energy transducer TonB [Candidatus Rokubacteria bacterium]|nr:energy transducer TonB [Candidatus Rokubacteria bacterium]